MEFEPDRVFVLVVGIVRRDGDVLMVRQAAPGESPYWALPGGRVEPNEALVGALIREVREETGISLASPELLYVKQVLASGSDAISLVFVFTGEPSSRGSKPAPQDPDGYVLEAAYLPVAEAIRHQEAVFGPDEPTVGYLAGRVIERVWTTQSSEGDGQASDRSAV